MGFVIVVTFVLTWAVAFTVYRLRRVEEKWAALVEHEHSAPAA
jgi:hypothetical protein